MYHLLPESKTNYACDICGAEFYFTGSVWNKDMHKLLIAHTKIEYNKFQDKLSRRNIQIKELKKNSLVPQSVAQCILATAIKWLQSKEVDNPFKGCQGIDCEEIEKAINAVNKVVHL